MIVERRNQEVIFEDAHIKALFPDSLPVNDLLIRAFHLVSQTFMHPLFDSKTLFYPQLDKILLNLSDQVYSGMKGWSVGSGLHLVIGSQFSKIGGHSRVAKSFSALTDRCIVVVTDPFNQFTSDVREEINHFFSESPVIFVPNGDLCFKVFYLRKLIQQLQPDCLSCFNHHGDPIPVVATAMAPVPRRIYYHHCDYRPSLGASINSYAHVDSTSTVERLCRQQVGDTCMLVDMHDDRISGSARIPVYEKTAPLNTVSAGGSGKYAFSGEFSMHSYNHVIPFILKEIEGYHHHFGDLQETQLYAIRNNLIAHAVDPGRFKSHGYVESISEAIASIGNPVYIPSFPTSGGMTIVEAMSTGAPLLVNGCTEKTDYYDFVAETKFSLFPVMYQKFDSVNEIKLSIGEIKNHYSLYSASSRKRYEEHHSKSSFLAALDQLRP